MAVYQIFPKKDATLYSEYPQLNSGLDEILELTKTSTSDPARILISFDQQQLQDVINNKINPTITSGSWSAYLRLFASEAESLPTDLTLLIDPIGQSWDQGTGRLANSPATENGACWLTRTDPDAVLFWATSSGVTMSFSSSEGGGSWYTGSTTTQSISEYTNKDIWNNVTSQTIRHYSGSISNYGYIIRVTSSIENDLNYEYKLSYFSRDTNTIYPPSLVFYWNDQVWNITSSADKVVTNQEFAVTLGNNKGIFQSNERIQMRVYARDTFPARSFVTSSLYAYNKLLPYNSWYQIVDVDTNDIIIPFDSRGTRISADDTSNYFNLDMDILEPERFYTIQVRVYLNGNYYTTSNLLQFKVVQNSGPEGDTFSPLILSTPASYVPPTPTPSGSYTGSYSGSLYIQNNFFEYCYISDTP
jgi:hypothetical protein